jgi:ABC-2 type transport system permease protein
MNPLLPLFVFAYVFPQLWPGMHLASADGPNFGTILVPGLVAVAIVFQGIAAVALPLAMELSATREVEDRVLAPLPNWLVASEKIVFAAVQGVVAGLFVFPLLYLVPATPVDIHVQSWPLLAVVVLLASLLSGALGLALGTSVAPRQIGLMFAVVVVPMTFLGCVYYPWAALGPIPWLKTLVLVNPLVYMSEGLRAALTPELPHMAPILFLAALVIATALLGGFGIRAFRRRTID